MHHKLFQLTEYAWTLNTETGLVVRCNMAGCAHRSVTMDGWGWASAWTSGY